MQSYSPYNRTVSRQSSYRPYPHPAQPFRYPPMYPALPPTPPARTAAGTRSAGGGALNSLIHPSGLTGILPEGMNFTNMLANAQKAIQTAQTVLPMLNQFRPLVKNVPELLGKLKNLPAEEKKEKASKNEEDSQPNGKQSAADPSENSEKNAVDDQKKPSDKAEKATDTDQKKLNQNEQATKKEKTDPDEPIEPKPSIPRMYI